MPAPGVCSSIIQARHRKDGYGNLDNPERFLNQDFHQLKQYCSGKKVRFVDDMFPPDHKSIGQEVLEPSDLARVVWLRPGKFVKNPRFIVDGVSRFDFEQGVVGDCWFLASVGSLAFQKNILEQVMPLDQTFTDDYYGIFHFRFWRFGRWVDVVIDDKLPTIDGRLIFVRSTTPNELWPALLEKAYAKVCGSYADMNAGTPTEALVDFTGGVHICIQLSPSLPDLWELLLRAAKYKSLMGCGTPQGETPENTVAPNGLVEGHAYTVTGVKQVMSQNKSVCLVRLWNPWGKGEWNGDWSDRSPHWKTVSPLDREQCLSIADDGEFWMTLEDFCQHFADLDICCLCPEFLDGSSTCQWKASVYESRWVAGTTAGGCLNFDTFWINPQYRVTIGDPLGGKDGKQNGNNMLVSLMQKPDKRNRRLVQNLHVGFSVFEVAKEYASTKGKFPASFFDEYEPVAQTKSFMNAREVMELFTLKPGEYLIVPSTFNPNETASFILSILTKSETHVHENSGGQNHEPIIFDETENTSHDHFDEEKKQLFNQHSDKYDEVDAEQLQKLLNDKVLKGDLKSGGFSLDACRSMVALMDTSITGKLNHAEFGRLWSKVAVYKETFFRTDVSRSGTLDLSELRNAVAQSGIRLNDDMLNLMAVRYSDSTGEMSLESFISLILRLECMYQIFKQLSDGINLTLRSSEWMYVSMYT